MPFQSAPDHVIGRNSSPVSSRGTSNVSIRSRSCDREKRIGEISSSIALVFQSAPDHVIGRNMFCLSVATLVVRFNPLPIM